MDSDSGSNTFKTCIRCKLSLPVNRFLPNKRASDGKRQPCRKCEYKDQRRYNVAHLQENNQAKKRWKDANKEWVRSDTQRWQQENKDTVNAKSKRWRDKNRDRMQAHDRMRKATELRACPSWRNDIYIKDMYTLARLVSEATGETYHVDHVVPLRSRLVCGLHVEHNLQVIKGTDNIKKKNIHWPDMP